VSRLHKLLLSSTTAITVLMVGLVIASTTTVGLGSLRSLQATLVRTLHSVGLVTDAHAGGGGGGGTSMSSGPGTSEPATIQIGDSAKLIARVYAAVPVTVTCAPLPSPVAFGGIFVQLLQAQGRTVVQGSGFASLPASACNGAAATYIVDVYPPVNASGTTVPYRGGPAAASAFAYACDSANDCANGSAGPQTIGISG